MTRGQAQAWRCRVASRAWHDRASGREGVQGSQRSLQRRLSSAPAATSTSSSPTTASPRRNGGPSRPPIRRPRPRSSRRAQSERRIPRGAWRRLLLPLHQRRRPQLSHRAGGGSRPATSNWNDWSAASRPTAFIEGIDVFEKFAVVTERRDGLRSSASSTSRPTIRTTSRFPRSRTVSGRPESRVQAPTSFASPTRRSSRRRPFSTTT